MLISAPDGAALAFFGGLCKKAIGAAVCVGLATTGSREPGDGYFPVIVVIMMFFLVLTVVYSGPLMRLGPCRAGNKRRGKTPKRGAVGHLVNDAPLAIQPTPAPGLHKLNRDKSQRSELRIRATAMERGYFKPRTTRSLRNF